MKRRYRRLRAARMSTRAAIFAVSLLAAVSGAKAAACGNDGSGFEAWLADFKSKAAAQGLSPATLASALSDVSYDPNVVRLDRSQRSFKLSFEEFYARRVSDMLIRRGQHWLATHAQLLDRIEARFGVPGAVLVAIWGLETNYGADGNGGRSILKSLATLAYDCRRSQFFQNELLNALHIVERGDMTAAQLRGGWAGEIGPMQFLPSSYLKYAVDFDGDGRRDLVRSVPDMLASTANYLKGYGWQPRQGWEPGSANFAVIKEWNKADVYARTIAVVAARIADGR
jgi:lytic murein transglycosylase